MDLDVIVVGAGFAGLSTALSAARNGLKVAVMDRNAEVGNPVRTTGIFIQKIVEDFNIPKEFIENDVKGTYFYSPSGKEYKFDYDYPLFHMGNISKFEKWMAGECEKWGVKFYLGSNCEDIIIGKEKVEVASLEAKTVVLACGSNSGLVEKLAGDSVKKYLIGFEFVGRGIKPKDPKYYEVFFNHNISPGYCVWIAPIDEEVSHVGLCRHFPCKADIKQDILDFFKGRFNDIQIDEVRSNLIPISGPIKKTFGDRFLIVGDAAGQIGSLAAGGIFYSLNIGKIAGEVLSENIGNPSEESLSEYERRWKKEYGESLDRELLGRKIFDNIDSNEELEDFMSLFEYRGTLDEIVKIANETFKSNKIPIMHIMQYIFNHMVSNPKKSMKVVEDLMVSER